MRNWLCFVPSMARSSLYSSGVGTSGSQNGLGNAEPFGDGTEKHAF